MYPFIDQWLNKEDDLPPSILWFINTVILFHLLILGFYFAGLAKDLLIGAPAKV
jgi:hypothetical protein